MEGKVIIYTIPDCPFCKAAKEDLKKRSIEYQEIDVTQNPDTGWPRPIAIVHEIAHIVCPRESQPHGPLFIRTFLQLQQAAQPTLWPMVIVVHPPPIHNVSRPR